MFTVVMGLGFRYFGSGEIRETLHRRHRDEPHVGNEAVYEDLQW